jgi:putative FmdB family regulatory protein
MPLYEYRCEACSHQFEVIRKFSDQPIAVCPKCGAGPVVKLFSSPAIQFKGSGFYITDYARKDSGRDSGKKDSDGKETASKDSSSKESGSKESGSKESGSKESTGASTTKDSTSTSTSSSTPASGDKK